ncbi:MAG: hypothetical protein ACREO4_08275 [Lysobacter sp.]
MLFANDIDSVQDAIQQSFVDLDKELAYWRHAYREHPAFSPNRSYEEYEAALKVGIHAYLDDHARSFEEMRDGLGETYRRTRGDSRLDWDEASSAAAAAWHRMRSTHRDRAVDEKSPLPGSPADAVMFG